MSVSLVKGGKVNLSKNAAAAGSTLTGVNIGLGWMAKGSQTSGAEFDLDASAFVLGADANVLSDSHFVFYGNLQSPEGAVRHTGDNLTGAGDGDDEMIEVNLGAVPSQAAKIVFAVTIYEATQRGQTFGQVDDSFIRAINADTGQEMAKYALDMDASYDTAVVFGELVKRGDDWIFSANSAGFPAGLDGLCRQYGVNV